MAPLFNRITYSKTKAVVPGLMMAGGGRQMLVSMRSRQALQLPRYQTIPVNKVTT